MRKKGCSNFAMKGAALMLVAGLSSGLLSSRAMASGVPINNPSALQYIIEALETMSSYLEETGAAMSSFLKLKDTSTKSASGIATAAATYIDAKRTLTNAKNDAAFMLMTARQNAKIAGKEINDKAPYGELCENIRSAQIGAYGDSYAQIIKERLLEGAMEEDRNFKSSQEYVRFSEKQRCGAGTNGAGGFKSPLDEPDPACMPTAGTESEIISRYDADISIGTILPHTNKPPLEIPGEYNPQGVATLRPAAPDSDKWDNAQVLFIAGWNYCMNAAGPNSSPPWQNELLTEPGKRRTVAYASCKVLKSAYLNTCFDLLLYGSRPDCSDAANKEMCDEQHRVCADAKRAGVELPESFGNCDSETGEGLSPYQRDVLERKRCLASKRYVMLASVGARHEDILAGSDECLTTYGEAKKKLTKMREALATSMAAMKKLDGCWGEVGR